MSIDPNYCGLYPERAHRWRYGAKTQCACGYVKPPEQPPEVPAPDEWTNSVETIVATMRHLVKPTRKGESVETVVELIVHLARARRSRS